MVKPFNENVQAWFDVADDDYLAAKSLIKIGSGVRRSICFHAQQMSEKALKAFLSAHGKHIEKVHDLTRLVTLCAEIDPEFTSLRFLADMLTPFAVIPRYPDDSRPVTLKEAKEAVAKAEQIYNFVKSKLDPVTLV